MTKSFLMRDAEGRVGGYLICGEGTILLKASCCGCYDARLALLSPNGIVYRIRVQCDGKEHAYTYEDGIAHAALIDGYGVSHLLSDPKNSEGMEWLKDACVFSEQEGSEDENSPAGEEIGKHQEEKVQTPDAAHKQFARRRLPDRRWPPPACLPGARYHGGTWREEQTSAPPQKREQSLAENINHD